MPHEEGRAPEEEPGSDQLLVGLPGRLLHDVHVGRVEAQRGGRGPVRHQVHPQELQAQALSQVASLCRDGPAGLLCAAGKTSAPPAGSDSMSKQPLPIPTPSTATEQMQ